MNSNSMGGGPGTPAVSSGGKRPDPICPWLPAETLLIGRPSSKCNACGLNAMPSEETHIELGGYYPKHRKGCGTIWTHVTSEYVGDYAAQVVREMRPDLEFVPITPDHASPKDGR